MELTNENYAIAEITDLTQVQPISAILPTDKTKGIIESYLEAIVQRIISKGIFGVVKLAFGWFSYRHSTGAVQAFCTLYKLYRTFEIAYLYVAPEFRCQGIGKALLDKVYTKINQLWNGNQLATIRVEALAFDGIVNQQEVNDFWKRMHFYSFKYCRKTKGTFFQRFM